MKKRVAIVVIIILAVLIFGNGFGKRPFKDLCSVYLYHCLPGSFAIEFTVPCGYKTR